MTWMNAGLTRRLAVWSVLTLSLTFSSSIAGAAPVVRVGGTGAANEVLRQLQEAFQAETEWQVEVVPNLGSSGGLRALADGVLDVAVSGRPAKPDEIARGMKTVAEFRTPYLLVTSHKTPPALASAELARLYADPKATWPDGTPVSVVLRPKSDSDSAVLSNLVPGLAAAVEIARKRPEVPTAPTDQDNAELAQRVPGSLSGMTFLQFTTERPNLRAVALDGISPTLEALESGRYRHAKVLHFLIRDGSSPAALRFVEFLSAPDGAGAAFLRRAGAVRIDAPSSP